MNLYGSGNDPKAEKPAKKKITVPEIRAIKGTDRRISMVTLTTPSPSWWTRATSK